MLKSPQLIIVISGPERRKIVLEIDSRVVVVKTMKAEMVRFCLDEHTPNNLWESALISLTH